MLVLLLHQGSLTEPHALAARETLAEHEEVGVASAQVRIAAALQIERDIDQMIGRDGSFTIQARELLIIIELDLSAFSNPRMSLKSVRAEKGRLQGEDLLSERIEGFERGGGQGGGGSCAHS